MKQNITVCDILNNPPMLNNKFGAGAIGVTAVAALYYDFYTNKMMWLYTCTNYTPFILFKSHGISTVNNYSIIHVRISAHEILYFINFSGV
jgi:hypothetical protein